MERPLISFVVVCFNQEQFIREAVEGALAQTYSPLEIIISDDASKDGTFDVIREVVDAYRGPHSVRINRSEKNLGMGAHISSVMKLCNGKLVVGGAGDDVSLPERTEVIYQAWEETGRRATSIFSSYVTISETGDEFGVGGTRGDIADKVLYRPQVGKIFNFLADEWPVVVGCTHAWSPSLFEYFGPLTSDLEDVVMSFRTLAIGQMVYVNRPVVKYRRHGNNVSFFAGRDDARSFEHRERRLRWVNQKHVEAFDNMLGDIEVMFAKGRVEAEERSRLRSEAIRLRGYFEIERRMMDGDFFERLRIVAVAVGQGNFLGAKRALPRTLPKSIYRFLFHLREKWRGFNKDGRVSALDIQTKVNKRP